VNPLVYILFLEIGIRFVLLLVEENTRPILEMVFTSRESLRARNEGSSSGSGWLGNSFSLGVIFTSRTRSNFVVKLKPSCNSPYKSGLINVVKTSKSTNQLFS
jgi:hypothetical protein